MLTLKAARDVIAAAEAQAVAKEWPYVIAVTDDARDLMPLECMDASPMPSSVTRAPAKALTAVLFRKRSQALEDSIRAGRAAAVTAGFVEMSGGFPLMVDGELIRALDVSSALPEWRVQIASAGAAALT